MKNDTSSQGISLDSFNQGYRALVFGSSGGIGAAMVAALAADPRCDTVYAASRRTLAPTPKTQWLQFSYEDETSIPACLASASAAGPLDLIIVATGLLHADGLKPEKTWRSIDAAALEQAFRINPIGPAVIARHALDHLNSKSKAIFAVLSARVGSLSDNRLGGWHSYRASKAALNMLIKTCAIELERRNPTAMCVSLHPGTVDTDLSKPFQSGVDPEKLFSAQFSATALLEVIDGLEPKDSGAFLAWDGSYIPY